MIALDAPSPVETWAAVVLGPGVRTLFTIDSHGNRVSLLCHSESDALDKAFRHPGRDVWVGMARLRDDFTVANNRRGTFADVESIHALWLDLDIAGPGHKTQHRLAADVPEARTVILAGLEVPPTCIVHTGGGLHAYWALIEPLERDEAVDVLARWGEHWQATGERMGVHVDSIFDLTRIMRVPGTSNHKTETPRPVEIIDADWTNVYNPSDLTDHLAERVRVETPSKALAPVAGYIGPGRPGDDFAARHTCGEVLAANGWVLDRTNPNGDQQWRRPGKDRRQGTSATVFAADGRCVIWTDAIPGLSPRDSLNPYRLWAKLEHGGDFSAASKDLAGRGYGERYNPDIAWVHGVRSEDETEPDRNNDDAPPLGPFINWTEFWGRDHAEEEWLAKPLLPAGRSVSIVAPGGTGKSLLTLYVAAGIATGRSVLGCPAMPARSVLYLDYEMTEADLAERLEAMGYGPDVDLGHLHYALLPSVDPLNTAKGASVVVSMAELVDADLVVIDTFSRAVQGEENDSAVVLDFYRLTAMPLKAAGRTLLRLDHTGKDLEKGARGTSAKRDDVDVAWILSAHDGGLTARANKRRVSWVPETVTITKLEDEELVFTIVGNGESWPAGTAEVAARLDALGVSVDASRRVATDALKGSGVGVRTKVLAAALRFRRHRQAVDNSVVLVDNSDLACGKSGSRISGTGTPGDDSGTPREPLSKSASDQPGTAREQREQPPRVHTGTTPVPYRGTGVPRTNPEQVDLTSTLAPDELGF